MQLIGLTPSRLPVGESNFWAKVVVVSSLTTADIALVVNDELGPDTVKIWYEPLPWRMRSGRVRHPQVGYDLGKGKGVLQIFPAAVGMWQGDIAPFAFPAGRIRPIFKPPLDRKMCLTVSVAPGVGFAYEA
ncbi:MAG TPA: hypothetical protein VFZ58_01025 [Candidatus Saccharimonadales bacterium]